MENGHVGIVPPTIIVFGTACHRRGAVRKNANLEDLAKPAMSQASKALAKRTQEEQRAEEVIKHEGFVEVVHVDELIDRDEDGPHIPPRSVQPESCGTPPKNVQGASGKGEVIQNARSQHHTSNRKLRNDQQVAPIQHLK